MMRAACLVLSFALSATPAAAQQLRISVRPEGFSFSPTDVEVRLRAEPGGRQREVFLEIDGPFYASSLLHVREDPTAPSVLPPTWYRSLPPGQYVITATLSDCAPEGCGRREQLRRVQTKLRLLARGDELPTPAVDDEP